MSADDIKGGGNPSYKGYAYQKLVTVWVGLTLMFGPGARADQITVEPASYDDVKANLAVDDEAAEGNLTLQTDDELHVQIKFKGAGQWSAKDFAGVIKDKPATGKKGPAPRPRAVSMLLQEPARRYVFITNRVVDAALAKGVVATAAQRPDAAFLPTNLGLGANEEAALAGRFALIEQMTPTETRRQIDEILMEHLKVPAQKLDACVDQLKRLVEDRFLETPDPLRKSEIERVAEAHEGKPHIDPRLAHYVAPPGRAAAEDLLSTVGAVLLIGPSGYGKTLTAESLVFDRRTANPPFKIVRKSDGPGAIDEAFRSSGRVVFHLEDLWGQSDFKSGEAGDWTNHIAKLLPNASAHKQFIITSRNEIYWEALSDTPPTLWSDRAVTIDHDSYDRAARRKILHDNLTTTSSWRRDMAVQHERRLLKELDSPIEIDGFTKQLRAVAKPEQVDITKLIDRAQTDGRMHVVMEHARGFGANGIGGAAVLWALLRQSRSLARERLRDLRRQVERESPREWALDSLADELEQTQLELDTNDDFVAHGKVVEALERVARQQSRAAERALNDAASAAATLAKTDETWREEFQRLVEGGRLLAEHGVRLDDEVVAALDQLLIDTLKSQAGNKQQFRQTWQDAVWHASPATPIGKLIKWLETGEPREKGQFDFAWRPPEMTAAERDAVRAADPDFIVLKGFVEHVLPRTHQHYDADTLLPWLKAFGIDLSASFIAAGKVIASVADYVMSADAISEGALSWPDPRYAEIWKQILAMDALVDVALAKSGEERRKAWQGELDYADGLRVQDQTDEEGPAATHYARGYVKARHQQQGFAWIKDHPRPDLIFPLWAEILRHGSAEIADEEIDALFAMAGTDDRRQAEAIRVVGERRLKSAHARVIAALANGGSEAVDAAVRALNWLEADGKVPNGRAKAEATLMALLKTLPPVRAARLAPFIVKLEFSSKKHAKRAADVVAAAAPEARASVQLALAGPLDADEPALLDYYRQLGPGEAEALIAQGPKGMGGLILQIGAAEELDVLETAKTWAQSDDPNPAQAAVTALGILGSPEARSEVVQALKHRHFEVRRRAMEALAVNATDAARQALFAMTSDKSAPVREALADMIGKRGWTDGIPALVRLLGDSRNYASHPERQRRNEPDYRVARTAAFSLASFGALPSAVIKDIMAAIDTRAATSGKTRRAVDVVLIARMLGLLEAPDDKATWDCLGRALDSTEVAGDDGENLYPIRYAAAWTSTHRLGAHPNQWEHAPWDKLEAAADHIDPQLAAPALLAIGAKLTIGLDAGALKALRGEHASPVRAALALSMINEHSEARELALKHALLLPKHPLLAPGADISTDKADVPRWPLTHKGRAWLKALQQGEDVELTLLWMMSRRTGLKLVRTDFNPFALRRRDTIPITTMSEMFGME
jgi:hypothetical protein